MSDFDGIRPRTSEEVRTYVFNRSTRDTRNALLNVHTRRTLDRCLRILREPMSHAASRQAALEVLVDAAPAYVRFGGDLHPW